MLDEDAPRDNSPLDPTGFAGGSVPKSLGGPMEIAESLEVADSPGSGSRPGRPLWIGAALLVVTMLLSAVLWLRGDIVDASACGESGWWFRDRSEIGARSWVSVPLPVAKVRGVTIRSYNIVAEGAQSGDIVIKVADHQRWENGRRTGLDFRGGAYGSRLSQYIPGIEAFLIDPIGAPLRVLPGTSGAAAGTSFDNVAMFVGATRTSEASLVVDHVDVTFGSGLRSQTCEVAVNFTLEDAGAK